MMCLVEKTYFDRLYPKTVVQRLVKWIGTQPGCILFGRDDIIEVTGLFCEFFYFLFAEIVMVCENYGFKP